MKIAMLTNNYRPFVGGVPISVERQARELIRFGHEVTVFAPSYGDTEEADREAKERIIRFHTQKRKMDNGMVYPGIVPGEILERFRREEFDCIHVHHPMFVGPCALYLGRKYGIPVIYTYHTRYEEYLHYIPCFRVGEKTPAFWRRCVEWVRGRVIPAYMKWFADQCDMVLAPSAGMRQVIKDYGTETRIEVFPTGLTEEFYEKNISRSAQIRQKFGNGRKHLLVTVSRLEKEKNYGFLLRGIAEVRRKIGDDFQVLIIGDGRQMAELKVRASLLGIQDAVTFLGNIPNHEVKDYLNAADLFLFASRSETQGIVLAEAMAAGNPVAAVHATGVDDIVRDGVNGFLTEEDEEAWADRVIEALDETVRRRMAAEAVSTAEDYRSSRLARYEEMLYNQCVCRKREERRAKGHALSTDRKEERLYEEENRREHSAVGIR